MIRALLSFAKILITVTLALLFNSCQISIDSFKGSGNVVEETRNVGGKFTKIKVDDGLEVELIQSEVVAVVVQADDNFLGKIKTEVKGNTLEIYSEVDGFLDVSSKKITVKMPLIESIETDGGASLQTRGVLRASELNIEADSGSQVSGAFEIDYLVAKSFSGSTIKLQGKAIELIATTGSGSDLNAEDLIANQVTANASSGSSIVVNPTLNLFGKASSGASVNYINEPKEFSKDESSGGSVQKK